MVQWKMGPSNFSFLSFRVVCHLHWLWRGRVNARSEQHVFAFESAFSFELFLNEKRSAIWSWILVKRKCWLQKIASSLNLWIDIGEFYWDLPPVVKSPSDFWVEGTSSIPFFPRSKGWFSYHKMDGCWNYVLRGFPSEFSRSFDVEPSRQRN